MNVTPYSGSGVWSGASAPMPPTQKFSNLFSAIDTSGSGSITKSQFETAFAQLNPPGAFKAAGADAIWSKLDPNGTGSVNQQDFVSTMTSTMKQLHGGHHHAQASSAGAAGVNQSTTLLDAMDANDSTGRYFSGQA